MGINVSERVKKYRNNMRSLGLRPVQIWVPDTRQLDFSKECLRQSKLVSETEKPDEELSNFIDEALLDIEGWTE
jgi:hypothetical protein